MWIIMLTLKSTFVFFIVPIERRKCTICGSTQPSAAWAQGELHWTFLKGAGVLTAAFTRQPAKYWMGLGTLPVTINRKMETLVLPESVCPELNIFETEKLICETGSAGRWMLMVNIVHCTRWTFIVLCNYYKPFAHLVQGGTAAPHQSV